MEDLRVLFFSHMIQTSLVAFTGLALVGVRLKLRQVLVVGIPMGVFIYVERALMLTYKYSIALHIVIGVLAFILAFRIILGIPLVTAAVSTIISYIIILSSETLFFVPVINYLKIDVQYMVSNPWLQSALGLLSNVPLMMIGCLSYFTRFFLLRLPGGTRGDLRKISDVGVRRTLH